jgi:hypothetical protein
MVRPRKRLAPHRGVKSNRDRLPQTYAEFVTHDPVRRKAIWVELSPRVRSRLWVEQLTGLRAARAGDTPRQRAVLEAGLALAADVSIFDGAPMTAESHQRLEELRVSAIDAFGLDQARAMFTNLGPAGAAAKGICQCSCRSDWCSSGCVCCASCGQCGYCLTLACGTLDLYECRGNCL